MATARACSKHAPGTFYFRRLLFLFGLKDWIARATGPEIERPPVSHRATASRVTPSFSAKAAWVRPSLRLMFFKSSGVTNATVTSGYRCVNGNQGVISESEAKWTR